MIKGGGGPVAKVTRLQQRSSSPSINHHPSGLQTRRKQGSASSQAASQPGVPSAARPEGQHEQAVSGGAVTQYYHVITHLHLQP